MKMDLFTVLVTLVITMTAAVTDSRFGKIPNLLTFPAILLGLLYAFFRFGPWIGFERILLLALLFLLGTLSLVGMGDLKLMMAIGALNGGLILAITAGIAALAVLIMDYINHRTKFWIDMRAGLRSLFTMHFEERDGTGRKVKFAPYLLFGFIGGVVVWFVC